MANQPRTVADVVARVKEKYPLPVTDFNWKQLREDPDFFDTVMEAVAGFAAEGGPVLGICNGFQVLTECGLLPGALQKNRGLKFLCATVDLEVATTRSALTGRAAVGQVLSVPTNIT